MKYYALSQKKDIRCPIGMLNGALYDKFYNDAKKIEHSDFPWYANPCTGKDHEKFPTELVFISRDRKYSFDIRSDLNFYYLISEKFNSLLVSLEASVVDVAPVSVQSKIGKKISDHDYFAAIFKKYTPESVADLSSSQFVYGEYGDITRIKKLVVSEDFSCHIFKISGMKGSSNTLICSETFRNAAIKSEMKGVDFLDASTISWPTVRPI